MPAPEGAQLSDDGHYWWDEERQEWHPVDGDGAGADTSFDFVLDDFQVSDRFIELQVNSVGPAALPDGTYVGRLVIDRHTDPVDSKQIEVHTKRDIAAHDRDKESYDLVEQVGSDDADYSSFLTDAKGNWIGRVEFKIQGGVVSQQ